MKDLKDKVAAITGAASGIGRALALNLAAEGCHVAIADVNEAGLKETADKVRNSGVRVTTHTVDVASREQVKRYADEVVKAHGSVHLIINNAGVCIVETMEDVSYEDFEWLIGINLWGVIYGCKEFLPYLKK
jgi:NAD(P)-dependent dehydrogenase (short-subunit alcohol dehydrogenase family)